MSPELGRVTVHLLALFGAVNVMLVSVFVLVLILWNGRTARSQKSDVQANKTPSRTSPGRAEAVPVQIDPV
jgi:hypothetical protein